MQVIPRLAYLFYLVLGNTNPPPCGENCWAQLQLEADRLAVVHDLPAGLLQGLMWVEARGDSSALGSSGDFGPMQIIPSTAAGIAKYTNFEADAILSDPFVNLQAGAWYLASLVRVFRGDIDLALAAYNAGPGAVLECNCVPADVLSYVNGVRWFWDQSWLPVPIAPPAPPAIWQTPNQWFGAASDLPPLSQCPAPDRYQDVWLLPRRE